MSRVIEKKILPEYFEAIKNGSKKYELRLNDFEISDGDALLLKEWDSDTKSYTGREIEKNVTYVRVFDINNLFWPKSEIEEKGFQIISFE